MVFRYDIITRKVSLIKAYTVPLMSGHISSLFQPLYIEIQAGLQAWWLFCGCTKAQSHPEAPSVNTKRVTVCRPASSIVICVFFLGWVLFIKTLCTEGQFYQWSPFCLSLLCLWLPVWVCSRSLIQNPFVSFQTPLSFHFVLRFFSTFTQTHFLSSVFWGFLVVCLLFVSRISLAKKNMTHSRKNGGRCVTEKRQNRSISGRIF